MFFKSDVEILVLKQYLPCMQGTSDPGLGIATIHAISPAYSLPISFITVPWGRVEKLLPHRERERQRQRDRETEREGVCVCVCVLH